MSTGFANKVHAQLPPGAYKPKFKSEFCELKPRKKRCYPENRQLREGMRYLVWSRYAKVFYERVIDEHTLDENLFYYLERGWVYLWPDEEMVEVIREEIENEKIGYRELMWRRQCEWDYYDRHNGPPTGDGDKFWTNYYKEEFHKYLKKKS